ncbi:hypothetical protein GCM10007938_00650 [Vibrio zhanjiangensis]|uniref:Phage tail protein n=1 Tax=Vibrio zhanjiangensis TaxID=1046128 RepID=A0ABQ6ETD8_9VIBR|nr:hypothetical protein [Vibrio zhanjiangensis]GLT16289.1 hypothetical protein GCM10007938_00650 [Vibrio zhanjiangensis]
MLLVETETGKISGVGDFTLEERPTGYHLVDGPYSKHGKIVENIAEISDEIAEIESLNVLSLRQKAYYQESDPLYLEWQYDKTAEKEQQWRDKVTEIKARYPLPPKA